MASKNSDEMIETTIAELGGDWFTQAIEKSVPNWRSQCQEVQTKAFTQKGNLIPVKRLLVPQWLTEFSKEAAYLYRTRRRQSGKATFIQM